MRFVWFSLALCFAPVYAQQLPTGPANAAVLSLEISSVHPNASDEHARTHIYNAPDNCDIRAVNGSLLVLIRYAWNMPERQILGAAPWLNSERFDVEGKCDAAGEALLRTLPSSDAQAAKRHLLQELLADRFSLKVHTETRSLPIFTLLPDKGGLHLQPAQGGHQTDTRRGRFTGKGVSVATLAEELGRQTGRPVVDGTGASGLYDIDLTWSPEDDVSAGGGSGPTIFTALQEQLGLRLEAGKGPVAVLVIDHAEHPSPN